MGLFDRFRRRTLRDPVALGSFIDGQSFLLAETVVQDYLRALAGADADALFADPSFRTALERAQWEVYPRALAMTGVVVDGQLRPHAGDMTNAVTYGLVAVILEAFDKRPAPPTISEVDWRAARTDIQRSLNDLVHQRPMNAEAAVQQHSSYCLAIMPLHAKLRGDDFPALCSRLKKMLVQIGEAFAQHANLPALAEQLAANAQDAPLSPE